MCFASNSRLKVERSIANRLTRSWVTNFFQIFEMAVGVAGFTFRSRTKYSGNIVITFDISLLCKIQVTAVCLRLTGKSCL
jgi:hypothetical protein